MGLLSSLVEKFYITDINVFLTNVIIAAVLIGVGIFLGKIIGFLVKKIIEKSAVGKTAKKNFIELFLTVVKWSIYILFISLALDQLKIPQLTNWLTSVLVVIPAFVGSLILIIVGFSIGIYLRDLIEGSEILDKKILGSIFFYFTIYIFIIFALKAALISQDKNTVNWIIIILTGIISAGLAYWHVRK